MRCLQGRSDIAESSFQNNLDVLLNVTSDRISGVNGLEIASLLSSEMHVSNPWILYFQAHQGWKRDQETFNSALKAFCDKIEGEKREDCEHNVIVGDSYRFNESFNFHSDLNNKLYDISKSFLQLEAAKNAIVASCFSEETCYERENFEYSSISRKALLLAEEEISELLVSCRYESLEK